MVAGRTAAKIAIDRRDQVAALIRGAVAWLTLDATARMIVDDHLNLLWWNPRAEALLAGRKGIEIRSGAFAVTDPLHQAGLRDLIQDTGEQTSSLCLELPEGAGWLLVRCQGLGEYAPGLYGLALTIASDAQCASYEHLDTAFELTRAEHRVLRDMLAGNEAESLAALHGVSIETTRTHIRNIYAKVGVNSRESLFARVQGFRA